VTSSPSTLLASKSQVSLVAYPNLLFLACADDKLGLKNDAQWRHARPGAQFSIKEIPAALGLLYLLYLRQDSPTGAALADLGPLTLLLSIAVLSRHQRSICCVRIAIERTGGRIGCIQVLNRPKYFAYRAVLCVTCLSRRSQHARLQSSARSLETGLLRLVSEM